MRRTPESLVEIPTVDISFVFRRNLTYAIETSYIKAKGEYPPPNTLPKKRLENLIKSVSETATTAAAKKGRELEHLKLSLPRSNFGPLAEIFALWASRRFFGEEFAVSFLSFEKDFSWDADFRFRQKTTGEKLYFNLYIGVSPKIFQETMNSVHQREDTFTLPLCLGQNPRFPDFINRILRDYEGLRFGELKEFLAIQIWHAAQTGKFAPEILPPKWHEAVKNRILAGYLIKREAGRQRAEVACFEKMIFEAANQK